MSNALDALIGKGISLFSAKIDEATMTMHAKFDEKFNQGVQQRNATVSFRQFDLQRDGESNFVKTVAKQVVSATLSQSVVAEPPCLRWLVRTSHIYGADRTEPRPFADQEMEFADDETVRSLGKQPAGRSCAQPAGPAPAQHHATDSARSNKL